MNAQEALQERQAQLEALCRRFGVRRLELFGSATTDDFDEESDFDFLVELDHLGNRWEQYFGLLEALEALLGRAVDLVEDGAITNPYTRASVDRTKTLVFAA
jgi:predicted nucleotidyltransferase